MYFQAENIDESTLNNIELVNKDTVVMNKEVYLFQEQLQIWVKHLIISISIIHIITQYKQDKENYIVLIFLKQCT